jgi:hypothetical protein
VELRSVREFGAVGDGVVDDSGSIQHAVDERVALLHFPPGDYRITKPINVTLGTTGRFAASGAGGTAKVIMTGAGPAFRITGTHRRSAGPETFEAAIWSGERLPVIQDLEIEGRHDEADGIYLEGTMQSTFMNVLIRQVRHGIHVHRHARNVLISHCHIYDNRGVGVFFEEANLHQVNIVGSHISYNRLGGIKILNGQVRNVQITGNDIEYNYDREAGENAPPAAEIWIETSGDGTIREGAIGSNTIQSRYSPGGANIMMIGREDESHRTGMFAITGNLIGSQETNVKLAGCRGVTITGNMIYSGHKRNLHVRDSRNIVATGNTFDHNPDYLPRELATGVTFERSQDCLMSGSVIQDAYAGTHTVDSPAVLERQGLVEIIDCTRVTLNGCHIIDGAPYGVYVQGSQGVSIEACTIVDSREQKKMLAPIMRKDA